MNRRTLLSWLGGVPLLAGGNYLRAATRVEGGASAGLLLQALPCAAPQPELVLFGFDKRAFPFQNQVQTHLITGQKPRFVLRHGPPGSHDEVLLYYGTVIRINDTFHMWYTGNYGPLLDHIGYELTYCYLCYATSKDGVTWEKPSLGLVEYKGSKQNNICDLPEPALWSTAAVLYDPEDPDPNRRFKIAYEAGNVLGEQDTRAMKFCVAFSPDGLRWKPSPRNPVGPFLEMAGITKFRGFYYVNGQASSGTHGPARVRRLVTFVSDDFEHWSPFGAMGLDRASDVVGPSRGDHANQAEEIHLAAALWNRGNVVVGVYGQWHGHFSGDRRWVVMDLGLAISHDCLHFHEPIPGFRLIPAREQPESAKGVMPALMQGQGMENFGDQTLYWYAPWRGTENSGVRMVTWPRDRLGMLKPFLPQSPRVISCPIQVLKGSARVFINASGLSQYSRLRVGLLTEAFRPIRGYSDEDAAIIAKNGMRVPVRWRAGDTIPTMASPIRLDIRFDGVRPEDSALHAAYVSGA